jgi:hypothetical protein
MIFGQKSQFAIEAEPLGRDGSMCFGHLRFWLQEQPIGDFEDSSDLAASARWGRRFLSASSMRTRGDLDDHSDDVVYHALYGRFFERGGSAPEEPLERDAFVLDEIGESALRDRASVIVVRRTDGRDRVVLRDHDTEKTTGALLAAGLCDRTIDRYCSWVEGLMRADTSP